MRVNTRQQAWDEANRIIPNDYEQDMESSKNAGYPIYRSNVEHYDYICDLGDRLEVNLKNGKSINIWIDNDEEPKLPTKEQVEEAAAHQYTFEPEQVQLVRVFASGYEFESEAEKAVYKAMKHNDSFWQHRVGEDMVDAYCKDRNIEWGIIRVINITHYPKNDTEGHFVIEAIVAPRTKK